MVKGGLTTRGPRNLLRQIREAMAGGGDSTPSAYSHPIPASTVSGKATLSK